MKILQEFIKTISKSLAFVTGSAWNTALTKIFDNNKIFKKYGLIFYAIIITIINLLFIVASHKFL